MIEKIDENLELVKSFSIQSKEEAEAFRIKYLGKKGILNDFFTFSWLSMKSEIGTSVY